MPEFNNKAMYKLSYGLFVCTAVRGEKKNGCITNTAIQVASDPNRISVAINKANFTHDMIKDTGLCNISVISKEASFDLFKHFGFQSGRDVDKFEGADYNDRMANGIRYLPVYTNAVFSCDVIQTFDLGVSTLFIADVVEAKVLSKAPSATYAYYHAHIKPKNNPAPEQKEGWRCKVCGYFYEGHELPENYVCPLCNHGPDDFEYVPGAPVKKVKGFICKICGHFEPYDGEELPADYVCPLCNHGRDDFEPAER